MHIYINNTYLTNINKIFSKKNTYIIFYKSHFVTKTETNSNLNKHKNINEKPKTKLKYEYNTYKLKKSIDYKHKKVGYKQFYENAMIGFHKEPKFIFKTIYDIINIPKIISLKKQRLSHNIKMKIQLYNKKLEACIKSIPSHFISVVNSELKPYDLRCDDMILEVVNNHNSMIFNHSIIEGSTRYKAIRTYAISLLEGLKPEPVLGVALGIEDRWPSCLNTLRPLFYRVINNRCRVSDRTIRSLLYIDRLCSGNDFIDTTDIEKVFDVDPKFIAEFDEFLENLKIKKIRPKSFELKTRPIMKVLRAGPNSKPKWQTAEVEAYALMNSEIHDHFYALCHTTDNKDLYAYMQSLASQLTRQEKIRIRYIVSVKDKGNKCRLVAISDYWTQVILNPIMKLVQEFIERRYGDLSSAKSHANGFNILKDEIKPGIMSYDIKSWTDAFPSSLQKVFMSKLFGEEISHSWYNLVVNCSWDLKGSPNRIKYYRGQGMGTAGSFDIATATDLLLLEMIYAKSYSKDIFVEANLFNKVGDDLWCWDPDAHILNTYKFKCGMDISHTKTKQATKDNLCAEFVSRNINYGRDVSRISANICRAVKANVLDLPELARHLEEREYQSTLPLIDIIDSSSYPSDLRDNIIVTLYCLSLIYHNKPGMTLLNNSLKFWFHDKIFDDKFIKLVCSHPIDMENRFYKGFLEYSIQFLNLSIWEKTGNVNKILESIEEGADILEGSEPRTWWRKGDNIAVKTSKIMLTESYYASEEIIQEIKQPSEESAMHIDLHLSKLEHLDQVMTFKELGVISTGSEPWRPRTTRLYNYVKLIKNELNFNTSYNDVPYNLLNFPSQYHKLFDIETSSYSTLLFNRILDDLSVKNWDWLLHKRMSSGRKSVWDK